MAAIWNSFPYFSLSYLLVFFLGGGMGQLQVCMSDLTNIAVSN